MHAVYVSNLDAALRPVALAFAWFANDDGTHVWPAVSTVSRMLRWSERTIQRRLLTLRELGVLELEDPEKGLAGGQSKTARYRFNLRVLAALPVDPPPRKPRQPCHPFPLTEPRQPCHPSPDERVTAETQKGDSADHLPRHVDPSNGDTGVTRSDIEPTRTYIELTDADASESSLSEEEDSKPRNGTPFKVFAAIATNALTQSLREDKTDRFDNVLELFKRACAQHNPPLPYDAEISRKAVEAALHSRAKAAEQFHTKFRQFAGRSL
jgi:hypothetical protein